MMHFKKGSHVYDIVTLLSVTGEFPVYSLYLLGSKRSYRRVVSKLTETQVFINDETGERYTCKLITISGNGALKGIRLCKSAMPLLDWISPDASRYYMDAFGENNFSGDRTHKERNYRVAEAVQQIRNAGVNVLPYTLPRLQNIIRLSALPGTPVFYLAKEIKRVGEVELSKTMYSRMIGAIFYGRSCYAVYNVRKSLMKWKGYGELKVMQALAEVAKLNSDVHKVDSALIFGSTGQTAIDTLLETDKSERMALRFDSVYPYVHFISMDEYGARLLRLLLIPDFNEKLLDLLFEPKTRSYNNGSFEYDAYMNGAYILSHFDGDIARLIRFKQAIETTHEQCEVLCFPHQTQYVKQYLGELCQIKNIKLDVIESELIGKEVNA